MTTSDPSTVVPAHLLTNPDYMALTHALSLLEAQRARAEGDIRPLLEQRLEAITDPEGFISSLPSASVKSANVRKERVEPQKVAKAPHVEWSRYGVETKGLEKAIERGALRGEGVVDASRFG
ncbi:hypothetical protein SAICODRAFT_65920 [Saitoella complicata NRRL Y-17804]|nr:uncharacterized protein SAICODRAFT_65920 [Saitoella complicata NRRL Y-17804]ODQ52657.1 hypothetical protein SAICODRAFT_65920 [Saitoella complicata NRRL Y-17804]